MPAAPATHIPLPTSDARDARERQVTSRAAWRRDLPTGLPAAANDNDAPISRPAPAKLEQRLEAMLEWTYRCQRAHTIIREDEEAIDRFLWAADKADLLTNPADRRQLHIDALIIHDAVLKLGREAAALIIGAAVTGMWPEPMTDQEPRPIHVEPSDRYDDFGRHVCPDGTRIEYLIRTAEIASVPQEEYEIAGRKKMRRAKVTSWEKVPVRYCVLQYDPEPEFVEAENRRFAAWQGYRGDLMPVLRTAPFRDHVLAAEAANDNRRAAANDNEPIQEEAVA